MTESSDSATRDLVRPATRGAPQRVGFDADLVAVNKDTARKVTAGATELLVEARFEQRRREVAWLETTCIDELVPRLERLATATYNPKNNQEIAEAATEFEACSGELYVLLSEARSSVVWCSLAQPW